MSAADYDALRDLLGHADDGELIEVISRAISDAQTEGRVEYNRRVGYVGRRTIAQTILWRLREHARPAPPPEGSPQNPVHGVTHICPAPGYAGRHTAVGAGALSPPYRCHGCGAWFTLPAESEATS